jgi:hypothetical protein
VLATLSIYGGLNVWNNFILPLVLTQSNSVAVLPLDLTKLEGQYAINVEAQARRDQWGCRDSQACGEARPATGNPQPIGNLSHTGLCIPVRRTQNSKNVTLYRLYSVESHSH